MNLQTILRSQGLRDESTLIDLGRFIARMDMEPDTLAML